MFKNKDKGNELPGAAHVSRTKAQDKLTRRARRRETNCTKSSRPQKGLLPIALSKTKSANCS